MIPKLDSDVGILTYCTNFEGTGGKIKDNPEDFEVSEAISEKRRKSISEEGEYAVYKLKKRNIDTNHAISDIFRKKGLRLKSLGLKDSFAITDQYVCANNKGRSIDNFSTSKYSIEKIGFLKKPLSKKDMIGNHFKIKLIDSKKNLLEFNEQDKVLNFYGYQRFGSKRPVTHLIGKAILQKNFTEAINLILTFASPYDSKENNDLREKLHDKSNYSKLFEEIPPQMDIERLVVKDMMENDDPQKAIRQIPLNLRRFYIQAYQSFLFNLTLSNSFLENENLYKTQDGDVCFDENNVLGKFLHGADQRLAIPLVGYSYYKKTRFDYYISKILESEEVSPRDFFIKEMQEVSNEGGFRQAKISCRNYLVNDNFVEFSLSRGSFATILLREIMKPSDPIASGF